MCSLFLLPTHRGGGLPTFHLPPVCAGKPSLHDWSRSSELLQGRKGSLHWRDKVADLCRYGCGRPGRCGHMQRNQVDRRQTREGHCPMNNLKNLSLTVEGLKAGVFTEGTIIPACFVTDTGDVVQ